MTFEELIAANTAALIDNTAAHKKLAEVAMAAAGGKANTTKTAEKPKPEEKEPEEKETAIAKKKRLAAEKKAAAEAEAPELVAEMSGADFHKRATAFLSEDLSQKERDTNKANFVAGLSHVGAAKFSEVKTDEDRARVAAYVAYWTAGLDVDFEAIDEMIAELGGEGEADPMG